MEKRNLVEEAPKPGDGSGDGSGYGYGSYGGGSGDGYGYGYGSGYGYGDGSGDGDYWKFVLNSFLDGDKMEKALSLEEKGCCLSFWRSRVDGSPANGGRSKPVTEGDIQEESGPLELCEAGTLHSTLIPTKWQGSRIWIVAMYPPFIGEPKKYGSLKREIICEVTDKLKCLN